MAEISESQWVDWGNRVAANEHLEEEMQNAGALPNWNAPLPPTNATIHLLGNEIDYGKRSRQFIALCGVSWFARESTGEHKYFMPDDYGWHKHINCQDCRKLMEKDHG